MKTLTKMILSSIIIATLFLCSCGLNKTIYSSKKSEKIEKIALISTFIEFRAPTGLLHAAIMNDKINSISNELNILFEEYADIYRDSLGSILSRKADCEVIYGKLLQSNPGFAVLKEKYDFPNALATGKETWPYIFQASGDINPFQSLEAFTYIKPDTSLLKIEKHTIQALCKALDVNYIAVSCSGLSALQGDVITRGTLSLVTVFSLFDKDGDYVAWGNRTGGGKPISAGKVEEYPEVLNTFFIITNPMVSEILNKCSH